MDKLFEGVPVEKIIVHDFLVHGKDQSEVDEKTRRVLDRSREVGLKFNPKKVKLRVPEVSYVGYLFSAESLKPDPEKIRAINEMPPPVDKESVLRILGHVNYLDKIIEHKAHFTTYTVRRSICLGKTLTRGFQPSEISDHECTCTRLF